MTIKGQAAGTGGIPGDNYGIVAEIVGAFSINGSADPTIRWQWQRRLLRRHHGRFDGEGDLSNSAAAIQKSLSAL